LSSRHGSNLRDEAGNRDVRSGAGGGVRVGKQACNNCRYKNAGPAPRWAFIPRGNGYRVALQVAAYYAWNGTFVEGTGVTPDVEEPFSVTAIRNGRDAQL
jgi:hypothetical protein